MKKYFRMIPFRESCFNVGQNEWDIVKTRKIANIRIHVERVTGSLRPKYTILESTLPTDYLRCNKNDTLPSIDRIIKGCTI